MSASSVTSRRVTRPSKVLAAGSRLELLRCTRTVVRDVAPEWEDDDGAATIEVTDARLTREDVWYAFDEIHERYHVSGIDLGIDEQPGRAPPCDSARHGLSASPFAGL